ncbi:MAG: ABC transporter ATP-binding protein, partial [Phyllobacterium sp.]
IRLSFSYIEPRHRFGLLNDDLMAKIVDARARFHKNIPDDLKAVIERYDPKKFIAAASLMDNVLFGRVSFTQADGAEKIRAILRDIFDKLDLFESVLSIGLDFDVGSGGKRLTNVQRQKLNVARALLKRSDYLIMNRPFPALDQRIQDRITHNIMENLHEEGHAPAIIWVLSSMDLAKLFDRVVVFENGALVEDGTYDTLLEKDGVFKQLAS